MDKAVEYIIGGVVSLLVLMSLAPTIFEQYNSTSFADAPAGVEAVVSAVITIFFVLILWKMYKES